MVRPMTCEKVREMHFDSGTTKAADLLGAGKAEVAGKHGVAVEKTAVDGGVCNP
jgi:hypothetical protein